MRFSSVLVDGRPAVARTDAAGQRFDLLAGLAEIGPDTPLERLVAAAGDVERTVGAEDVVLRPVVPAPRRIICLGLNYRAHVDETGRDLPTYPVLFTKWASSLAAAGPDLPLPPESEQVDFEAEMVLVVGRAGRRIPRARARDHVAGITIANDVTMRDFQYKTHQWLQGKAWDGATPVGPALVTLDELGDPGRLDISFELNGTELQRSNTDRLIFDPDEIIATVSTFTQLDPGDLILTGTPGGVGYRRDPKVLVAPGDEMVVTLEGVGRLVNRAVAEVVA